MWDLLRKTFALGLGAAAITGDKVREIVDEAVSRGEMSKDDGRKFIDEATKRGEEERQNMQNWIRDQVNKVLRDAGCAEVSRVEALEKRVSELELRLTETPAVAPNEQEPTP
jgi:polyhydroxyalkanoate synthesis regulator phasin